LSQPKQTIEVSEAYLKLINKYNKIYSLYQVLGQDMAEMKQYVEQYAMKDASWLAKEKKEPSEKTETIEKEVKEK